MKVEHGGLQLHLHRELRPKHGERTRPCFKPKSNQSVAATARSEFPQQINEKNIAKGNPHWARLHYIPQGIVVSELPVSTMEVASDTKALSGARQTPSRKEDRFH